MSTAISLSSSQLLSPTEAASRLGVRPQTLAVWRTSGRYCLPYVRCGRLIRYKPEDLDAWLESRRQTHTGQGVAQ